MNIGVLGSIAYDNIFRVDHVPNLGERVFGKRLGKFIGGMAANQAIEAARYTNNVWLLGRVGKDDEGVQILKSFRNKGIVSDYIQLDKQFSTGQTYMYLLNDDYYSIVTQGANRQIDPEDIKNSISKMISGFLLVSLEINPTAVMAAFNSAKGKNIESVLIPSPVENCTNEMYDTADSLILNQREFLHIFDINIEDPFEATSKLMSLKGIKQRILITFGKKGAALLDRDEVFLSEALKVDAVDAVGAGDALAGAFVGSLAIGFHPQKALSIGCIAGALATSRVGPQTSQHSMSDVLELYKKHYQ